MTHMLCIMNIFNLSCNFHEKYADIFNSIAIFNIR